MDKLILNGSIKTPSIELSPSGDLVFEGNSYPENCITFYKPVVDWVKEYSKSPSGKTTVRFYFKYFNTSTSGIIVEILGLLKSLKTELTIVWSFDKDDEETHFSGQNFAELLDMSFNFVEK